MVLAYSYEHIKMDAFELQKLFFEVHLTLDIKTTFRLQKVYLHKLLMETN